MDLVQLPKYPIQPVQLPKYSKATKGREQDVVESGFGLFGCQVIPEPPPSKEYVAAPTNPPDLSTRRQFILLLAMMRTSPCQAFMVPDSILLL
jgi:hypothetical protein